MVLVSLDEGSKAVSKISSYPARSKDDTSDIYPCVELGKKERELGSDGALDHLFHLPVADPHIQAIAGGRNQQLVRLSAYANPAEEHGALSRIWSYCYQKKSHGKLV